MNQGSLGRHVYLIEIMVFADPVQILLSDGRLLLHCADPVKYGLTRSQLTCRPSLVVVRFLPDIWDIIGLIGVLGVLSIFLR